MCILDKRATMCADCAYSLPWPPEPIDRVTNVLAVLVLENAVAGERFAL